MKGPVFTVLTLLILFTAACSKDKALSKSLDGTYRLTSVYGGWSGENLKKISSLPWDWARTAVSFTRYNFQPGDKGRYSIRIIPLPAWSDTVIYFIHAAGDTITRYKTSNNGLLYLSDGYMDGIVETYVKIGD